jgi:protein phosphatase
MALSEEDRLSLTRLPIRRQFELEGINFLCVHAIPSDPLFPYCNETSDQWRHEAEQTNADVLLVGHTHTSFIRRLGRSLIVNPGSLGQPNSGRPFACYAIYEDGQFELKEYEYPINKTMAAIRKMPIPLEDQEALISVLHTGTTSPPMAAAHKPGSPKGMQSIGGREG